MHTNHRAPEKHLLQHECLEQSLRFILLGAWQTSDPVVTAQVRRIHNDCGLLFSSLMGPEWEAKDEAQAGMTAEPLTNESSIVADTYHQNPAVVGRVISHTAARLGLPVKEDDMEKICHAGFYARFREAYCRDYEKTGVTIYGKKPLKWWNKVSFTSFRSVFPSPLLSLFCN